MSRVVDIDPHRMAERALAVAVEAALEAGARLRDEFHRPGGPRGRHGHAEVDTEAEAGIRRRLTEAFPDHGIRGEELGQADRPPRDAARHVWLVDPQDGTSAFLAGWRGAAVSIALLRQGVPVLGVVYAYAAPDDDGDLIAWAEGRPLTRNGHPVTRRWADTLSAEHTVLVSHDADRRPEANARCCAPARFRPMPSIAYRLALVAAGEAEVGVSLGGPGDWDVAAGHALLLGAGGQLYDAEGAAVTYDPATGAWSSPACFGGTLGPALALARRDWAAVFQPSARTAGTRTVAAALVRPVPGRTVRDPGRLRRAQGCLLGQVAGDALGSLVEFQEPEAIARRYPAGLRQVADGGTWDTIAGQPTDDSELALRLARALVAEGRFDDEAVARAYAAWFASGPFDVGSTTRVALGAALAAHRAGRPVADAARAAGKRDSQANGALMRVSPLGVFGHALPPASLAALAWRDATLTHPHPVCGLASAVFACAIARAVATGDPPATIHAFMLDQAETLTREAVAAPPGPPCSPAAWEAAQTAVADVVRASRTAPPVMESHRMGWVLLALGNAAYQLRHAASVEAGIVDTVHRGGDTDTSAAIAGALLGAVYGRDAIPWQWRDRVLTCRPIQGLPDVRQPRPPASWPVDLLVLGEALLAMSSTR